jgi:hypothetical protein
MVKLPMPICCNNCGRWFTDAGEAARHAEYEYKCLCGEYYCSSHPYEEINCLKCGAMIKREAANG